MADLPKLFTHFKLSSALDFLRPDAQTNNTAFALGRCCILHQLFIIAFTEATGAFQYIRNHPSVSMESSILKGPSFTAITRSSSVSLFVCGSTKR